MTPVSGLNKAALFKAKGAQILKPHNMEDFINDPQIAQIHKTTNAQKHKSHENLGRLHIQIRTDLIGRILDMVFKRKRDTGITKRTASQRAIVEEALEQYFKNNEEKNESHLPVDKTQL